MKGKIKFATWGLLINGLGIYSLSGANLWAKNLFVFLAVSLSLMSVVGAALFCLAALSDDFWTAEMIEKSKETAQKYEERKSLTKLDMILSIGVALGYAAFGNYLIASMLILGELSNESIRKNILKIANLNSPIE